MALSVDGRVRFRSVYQLGRLLLVRRLPARTALGCVVGLARLPVKLTHECGVDGCGRRYAPSPGRSGSDRIGHEFAVKEVGKAGPNNRGVQQPDTRSLPPLSHVRVEPAAGLLSFCRVQSPRCRFQDAGR
jgi:hypothetical protein